MGNVLTYIIFQITLFSILTYTGYKLTKKTNISTSYYWFLSIIGILSYSLIEGLRYGRGIDYMSYKNLYENSLQLEIYYDVNSVEYLFQLLNKTLRVLELPYPSIFVTYSLILIVGCFAFVKNHQRVALYAIPMFFMATIVQSENLVRQYVALSFVLISLNFFLSGSWVKFCIFISIAIFTHYSSIIFIPVLFLFKYIKRPFGNLYVILLLYLISWLWKPEYWGKYYQYFQYFGIKDNVYDKYIQNAEIWLSGSQLMGFDVSIFYLLRLFLFNIGLIILGYRILEKYRDTNYPFYYYIFVLGSIFERFSNQIEILYRIDLYFYTFWFIVLAYVTYDLIYINKGKIQYKLICYFLLFNILYDFLNPIIKVNTSQALFIWN